MEVLAITFGALFSVMNPLGSVPIFVGLTQSATLTQRRSVALWTAINVLIILLITFFLGKYILTFFGIELYALKIAGGLIISSSGFALLKGNFSKHKGMKKREKDDAFNRSDISLTPLALPMLAGPGTMSLLIAYQQEMKQFSDTFFIVGGIILAASSIFLVLSSAQFISNWLGASGINALSRIVGFIIIALGVQYLAHGATDLFQIWINMGQIGK